jgi:hypothetical protein
MALTGVFKPEIRYSHGLDESLGQSQIRREQETCDARQHHQRGYQGAGRKCQQTGV